MAAARASAVDALLAAEESESDAATPHAAAQRSVDALLALDSEEEDAAPAELPARFGACPFRASRSLLSHCPLTRVRVRIQTWTRYRLRMRRSRAVRPR